MTVSEPATPVCPSCGSTETMILSDGNGRCFDCQTEWDPKSLAGIPRAAKPAPTIVETPDVGDVPLPPTPDLPPFGMASTDEVFGTADVIDPESYRDRLDELVGGSATLEGGQVGVIVALTPDDQVVVRLGDNRLETVPMGDVMSATPPEPTPAPEPAPAEPPAAVVALEHVYELSDMMIRMGIASIIDVDGTAEPGPPPVGWLPWLEEMRPLVEAAAATTVARLITSYGIDVDDLLEGLDANTQANETGDPEEATE